MVDWLRVGRANRDWQPWTAAARCRFQAPWTAAACCRFQIRSLLRSPLATRPPGKKRHQAAAVLRLTISSCPQPWPIGWITCDATSGVHETPDIFTQRKEDLSKGFKARHQIYDYVFTDSTVERKFVDDLDASAEVVVYAKLPKTFFIPTPVGNYNPDWAIAFKQGEVKHVYFIAKTKGDLVLAPAPRHRKIQDRLRTEILREDHE